MAVSLQPKALSCAGVLDLSCAGVLDYFTNLAGAVVVIVGLWVAAALIKTVLYLGAVLGAGVGGYYLYRRANSGPDQIQREFQQGLSRVRYNGVAGELMVATFEPVLRSLPINCSHLQPTATTITHLLPLPEAKSYHFNH